jgi:hypothetical protein
VQEAVEEEPERPPVLGEPPEGRFVADRPRAEA